MAGIRDRTIEGLRAGDRFEVSRAFSDEEVRRFAEISRDYNPIHFDRRWTDAKGYADRACHGLLVASLLTEIGGQIGWLASGMEFRFLKPVYVGDTVTCAFTIVDIDNRRHARAEGVFRNQDGEVVSRAVLTGVVPDRAERELLSQMQTEEERAGG